MYWFSKIAAEKKRYFVLFLAEMIGTALLMFLGCMGCIRNYEDLRPEPLGAFAFGLTITLVVQMFEHISGAHVNPCVTIASVLLKRTPACLGPIYIVSQFVGAALGMGLLKVLVSDEYAPDGFCMTNLNPEITVLQGLGIEIVSTTVLVVVCCAVWDERNKQNKDSVPLRFGFVVALLALVTAPLTGTSMNTARSFGPVIFGGSWKNQWIYWVGPNVAPFIGCGIYKLFFAECKKQTETFHLEEVKEHGTD